MCLEALTYFSCLFEALGKVQERATKILPLLKNLPYVND